MRSLPYLVLVDDDEDLLPLVNLELGEESLAVDTSPVLPDAARDAARVEHRLRDERTSESR